MATDPVQAWADYRETLSRVYPETRGEIVDLAQVGRTEALDEGAIDNLIEQSDGLREAIVPLLDSEDPGQRELGALKLQAAAALDIDSANRLAAQDPDTGSPEATEAIAPLAFGGFLSADDLAQLDQILSTQPEDSTRILGDGRLEAPGEMLFGPQATDPAALKEAVDDAIDGIVADSSAFGSTNVRGLLALPGEQLLNDATRPVKEIFDLIDEHTGGWIGRIKRKAVKLLLRGIEKLLAIFGTRADDVRKKVAEWIKGLDKDQMNALFVKIFSVAELKKALSQEIDTKAPGVPPQRLDAAASEVSGLAARLHKQMSVLDKLSWVLGHTRKWVITLAYPWGLVGVLAAYLMGAGYAVFAAEDYLDWREEGILDLVDGVQLIVRRELTPA